MCFPGKTIRAWWGHEFTVRSLAFSHDGSILASSGGIDLTARLWDVRTGESLHILMEWGGWRYVDAVALSPNGRWLASGNDSKVLLWDVRTGIRLETFEGHLGDVSTLAFSPDGAMLASGGTWRDATIRLWDLRTAEATHALVGHRESVTSVAFSPDGLRLASGSGDDTVRMWDANTGERLRTIEGHSQWGELRIVFLPTVSRLRAGVGTTRCVYGMLTLATTCGQLKDTPNGLVSVAFSPDGLTLASGSYDGTILLWDLMRATTWSGTKRVSVTDETNQSTELSPSAKPVAPTETALLPNYPNPFNPETWIPYHLADDAKVTLNVYDAKGVLVRQLDLGYQPAGFYTERGDAAYWDGRNEQGETVTTGVYFCTLTADGFTATRKMLVGK